MLFSKRILTLPKYLRSYKNRPQFAIRSLNLPLRFNFCAAKVQGQKMQFKAQTKKLLDIVAKSLYTDSQVFLRQLLSNASDALQKQRFLSQTNDDLHVNIETIPLKKQIIIEDNGIGMSKQEMINNLGTIAKSGSKQFLSKLEEGQNNIIGQFGVGFYSSFIVADFVEVISRNEGSDKAYKWSSDGNGQFTISEVEDDSFNRGLKVILHMKADHENFLQNTQIQKIAQKYSNFINYPITLNGQALNLVKALWSRDKNQISQEEYQSFYQYLANKTQKYQYKIHLKADVPLSIKSVLFIPKSHNQKFGMGQQKGQVSLYSKKVLIKKDCKDILIPNFLRFVKGVVDCEDIPLNISRQNYQDSALMAKLRGYITKRILKSLKQQAEFQPEKYNKWYQEFNIFIKQGSLDAQFKKDVFLLNRYQCNLAERYISFKDYLQKKKPAQDRIFYLFSPSKTLASDSPYVYPLTKAGVPVLIANTHIDQVIFRQIDTYEGLKFSNVQTDTDDVERVLKSLGQTNQQNNEQEGIRSEQLTPFSLWIKNELQPFVDKVNVAKKNMRGPALVISPISSSMRQMAFMRQMMQQKMKNGVPRNDLRNITFEFNHKDPLIVKLNEFRKKDAQVASLVVRQIFDNCCMQAGLENDGKNMIERINNILDKLITKPKQISERQK